MLHGIGIAYGTECERMLSTLDGSAYSFYLTGSRFFHAMAPTGSDYDFFVETSDEVESFLISIGFKKLSEDSYKCSHIDKIFRKSFVDGSPSIDVQLVHDMEAKLQAQNIIAALKYHIQPSFNSMSKKQRKHLWGIIMVALTGRT